ncbi:hypothetical protein C9J19_20545 [Photobacterium phosphoreum]|uniref:hypothetical protein n=1 Tax=Photobacterium phosphoreum TaxID=659 RepID=UPI000D162C04|nr:hypothetical protein [Photobacterium phosphoreum]PSW23940.1 hypothetical protein C9J19_20545 [Photobacterium phosphoreum]
MDNTLPEIVKLIENTQPIFLAISIIIFLILKIDILKSFDFVSQKKINELNLLINALDKKSLSAEVKYSIKEKIETDLFYKSNKILANKIYRTALVKLNQKYPLVAEWHVLKRAYRYIKVDIHGNLKINLSSVDIWIYRLVFIISIAMFMMGLICFIFYFIDKSQATPDLIILGIMSIIIAFFYHCSNLPKQNALKLLKLNL